MSDLISRADAIEAVRKIVPVETEIDSTLLDKAELIVELSALPSADAVSREDYHNLLTALNDIDRALREYQEKEENPSAEDEPKVLTEDDYWKALSAEAEEHRIYKDGYNTGAAHASAEAVPQLNLIDTLIIADALRYLIDDEERHELDRATAESLREKILKYGASMCKGGEDK